MVNEGMMDVMELVRLCQDSPYLLTQISEDVYRKAPAVNKSTLWEMRKSPKHYKWFLEHPMEDTPALKLGRAVHVAVLQIEELNKFYAKAPNVDRRTKAGKEEYQAFLDKLNGREILSEDEIDVIEDMRRAVWDHPVAGSLLEGAIAEVPLFWKDEATGMVCKCRLDAIKETDDRIIVMDLKTAAEAKTDPFMRHSLKYGYDVQMAHYIRGVKATFGDSKPIVWAFIAVEKKGPYAVNVLWAGNDMLDRGTMTLMELMDKLKVCREKDEWPDYGENTLSLPDWALVPDIVDDDDE